MKFFASVLFCACTGFSIGQTVANPDRPNILYFYVDDMGWGAIGPNGQFERRSKGLPHLVTPTLDRLAAEGINFRRSYGCTVCSPARSSQQTGFHQGHTFADQNDPDNAKKAIRQGDLTMGDVLSAAGYVTGYWGKWGYGGSKSQLNPEILNIQTLPTSHGYQHVLAELHHVRAHTFFQPTLWSAPAATGAKGGMELIPNSMDRYKKNDAYPELPALQNHPDYPETAYCDDLYAFAALDFVRNQAQNYNQTGQPFFGLLAVQVPHAPYDEVSQLPEWDEPYRKLDFFHSLSDQARHWAAMVSRIDGHFGNILNALEDPNGDGDTSDSVADSTLVIFQSDNGGPHHPARVEFDANGGLRESKGRIEEGGIRVPLMIRLPSKFSGPSALKAGTGTDIPFDVTDFLPTFCALAGAPAPLGIDGVSRVPTLLGTGKQRSREFLIHEAGNGQSIIRDNYKLIRRKSGLELYDLETDHAEEFDLAAKRPKWVPKLESLLLGERVAEPKGFANTYHQWMGGDGALASDADNWSDYIYANEGITYMTDTGAPRISWTAHMVNAGSEENHAVANRDLEFLGLEIRGETAGQSLILDPQVHLTGRNEIRISKHGSLTVNGGTVSSLRWIEIQSGGLLKGTGTIDAVVYNRGVVATVNHLHIKSDYEQSENSDLRLSLTGNPEPALRVDGTAELGGYLSVHVDSKFKPVRGKVYTVLSANSVRGEFSNKNGQVVSNEGTQFEIGYSEEAVKVTIR